MDKIYAMQLFIQVAERESFSRAADALNLPKGSVSRHIQALETHLNTQLLHRTTRRVQLTQDGMVYYERAKDLLSNLEELDSLFQRDTGSLSGILRIDMPVTMAKNLLIPHLPAFVQQYPGIEIELSSSERPVDVIREGFDCAVRIGPLHDTGLIVRPLGKLSLINCASPDYLARFGYPETPEDLVHHALVHYAANTALRPRGFDIFSNNTVRQVKAGGILTVNSTETWHAACLAGLGIIQVPRADVKNALRSKKLIEILPQYRAQPLSVSLVYPPRRNLSRRIYLFMEWLTDVMKSWVD